MTQTLQTILIAAYALIGPIAWAILLLGIVKGRKRMSLLSRPGFDLPDPPPRATALVPVKDEARQIRSCVESIARLDYPELQIIVIDDRSTDGTGEILDDLAREHPARLTVVHLHDGDLPPGWCGKCHALHVGSELARSRESGWLLFVDSDVIVAPDALRATIALAEWKRYDLVSLLPRLEARTFWERLLIPLSAAAVGAMYLMPMTNYNELPRVAFANGQFMLVRRSAYEAMGGHAAVRHTLSEDVAIARMLKRRGFRPRLAVGNDFASTRMYDSLGAIMHGWARNFFSASLGRPWRILAAIAFVLVTCGSMVVAMTIGIARTSPILIALAAAHWAIVTIALARSYAWSGNPARYALLSPISAAGLLLIWLRALWMSIRGEVEWRGTRYDYRVGRGIDAESESACGDSSSRARRGHSTDLTNPLAR